MSPKNAIIAIAILAGFFAEQSAQADEWFLLSRHGECAPLSALRHKLPSAPNFRTPDDFSAYLELEHIQYTRQVHSDMRGQMVEFRVPDKGLAVLLVPATRCTEVVSGPR